MGASVSKDREHLGPGDDEENLLEESWEQNLMFKRACERKRDQGDYIVPLPASLLNSPHDFSPEALT